MFHRSDFQFSRPNAAATAMMAPSRKLLGVTVMVLMMTMAFQQCCLGFTVQFQDHVTSRSHQNRHPLSPNSAPCRVGHSHPSTSTELFGGGFGGASSGSKKTKGSGSGIGSTGGGGGGGVTLKPKQQWDRYSDMKKEKKIRVAVRPSSSDSSVTSTSETEWLEVGNVKSKEDKYTELAVVRQRAIIAEHARRLYPLQVSPKKAIEWGYFSDDDDTWKVVDKVVMDGDATSKIAETEGVGLEKLIGFEGRPDPASGFYCVYDGGRLKKE